MCPSIVSVRVGKGTKVFYECETLVKQVYLGQMGEQDAQRAGDLLPAPLCSTAAALRSLEVWTTDAKMLGRSS